MKNLCIVCRQPAVEECFEFCFDCFKRFTLPERIEFLESAKKEFIKGLFRKSWIVYEKDKLYKELDSLLEYRKFSKAKAVYEQIRKLEMEEKSIEFIETL